MIFQKSDRLVENIHVAWLHAVRIPGLEEDLGQCHQTSMIWLWECSVTALAQISISYVCCWQRRCQAATGVQVDIGDNRTDCTGFLNTFKHTAWQPIMATKFASMVEDVDEAILLWLTCIPQFDVASSWFALWKSLWGCWGFGWMNINNCPQQTNEFNRAALHQAAR